MKPSEFELSVNNPGPRSTAVSRSMKAIGADLDGGALADLAGEVNCRHGLRVLAAGHRELRERIYRFAKSIYAESGFCGDESPFCVTPYDSEPATSALLIEDAGKREAGTISVIGDSRAGLPCDEIFSAELAPLRAAGRKLSEITRLAVAEGVPSSKTLLVQLFNWVYVLARRVHGLDDFIIEVNPRHERYYQRLLGFESMGCARPCPRVGGAPAVLLRLNLEIPEDAVARIGGLRDRVTGHDARTLYPFFRTRGEEAAMATYLARHLKPMTEDEAEYFGIPFRASRPGRRTGQFQAVAS